MTTCPIPYSRTRTENSPDEYADTRRTIDGGLARVTNIQTFSRYNTISDVATPCYESKIRKGDIVNNGCTYYRSEFKTVGSGEVKFDFAGSSYHYFDGCMTTAFTAVLPGPHSRVTNPHPHVDVATARLRALADVDSTPYAMIEDIGELEETYSLLADPLGSLEELSDSFRKEVQRRRRLRKWSRAKAIASVWITYRFAFLPLMLSLYAIVESIYKPQYQPPPRRTGRGFHQGSDDFDEDVHSGSYTTNRGYVRKWSTRAGVCYQVSNPVFGWRHTYGLRAKDIPVGIWQLVPLSFMIDRLIDVSSSLRGIFNLLDPEISMLYSFDSLKFENISYRSIIGTDHVNSSVIPDREEYKDFHYIRTVWPITFFDVVPPVNFSGLISSSQRVADLVALIIQNLNGSRS